MIKGLYDQLPWQNYGWENTVHRRFTASSTAMFSVCFYLQPNLLPISLINKQGGRDVLEHSLSSQLPRCRPPPPHLLPPPLICSLKVPYPRSPPIGHVHKPTLNIDLEPKVFSAADIVMFLSESSSLQSGGPGRTKAGRDMEQPCDVGVSSLTETRHSDSTYGKLTCGLEHRIHEEIFCTEERLSANSDTVAPGITVVCAWTRKTRCRVTLLLCRWQSDTQDRVCSTVDVFKMFFPCNDHLLGFMCIYLPCANATWPLLNVIKWFPAAAL